MFIKFTNNEERRKYGGSAFVEFQFCKLRETTRIKKIVNKINHWQEDSLYVYVDYMDKFIESYGNVFNCGTYNNLKSGPIDIFGVNYYKKSQIVDMIDKLMEIDNNEVLINWLKEALKYNGFYILGI